MQCIPLGYKTYDGMMTMSPLGRGDLGHHTRYQRVSSDSDWPGWHFAKWVEQCGTSSFHWYCLGSCCAQGTRFTIKGCRLLHTALGGQVGGYSFGQAGRANQGTCLAVKVCQLPDCPGWAVLGQNGRGSVGHHASTCIHFCRQDAQGRNFAHQRLPTAAPD